MPFHEYITKLYLENTDPLYFNRFLDYIISNRFKNATLCIGGKTAYLRISGELVEIWSEYTYNSLLDLYNVIYKTNTLMQGDMSIFDKIWITPSCSLANVLSSVQEEEIIKFFDLKYRAYLLFRSLITRIKDKTNYKYGQDITEKIRVYWNKHIYVVTIASIMCDTAAAKYADYTVHDIQEFLAAYESGCIKDLYYYDNYGQYHLISEY